MLLRSIFTGLLGSILDQFLKCYNSSVAKQRRDTAKVSVIDRKCNCYFKTEKKNHCMNVISKGK